MEKPFNTLSFPVSDSCEVCVACPWSSISRIYWYKYYMGLLMLNIMTRSYFYLLFVLKEMAFWMIAGERQSSRIRAKFLRAVLGQDLKFFDLESSTGDLVEKMSGDMILVQEAMGEKVGNK